MTEVPLFELYSTGEVNGKTLIVASEYPAGPTVTGSTINEVRLRIREIRGGIFDLKPARHETFFDAIGLLLKPLSLQNIDIE